MDGFGSSPVSSPDGSSCDAVLPGATALVFEIMSMNPPVNPRVVNVWFDPPSLGGSGVRVGHIRLTRLRCEDNVTSRPVSVQWVSQPIDNTGPGQTYLDLIDPHSVFYGRYGDIGTVTALGDIGPGGQSDPSEPFSYSIV